MPLVLGVDDEEMIVAVATTALRRIGFATIGARSGTEALRVFRSDVDILLTDCVMPDIPGSQVAARLCALKPSLKVIFMSGNPMESLDLGVPLEAEVNFVQKPFDCEQLTTAVRRAAGAEEFVKA